MRRLITYRWVRLALAAAGVTAVIGTALLLRRNLNRQDRTRPAVSPAPPSAAKQAAWPPAPILGVPTADDLKRYAARPPVRVRATRQRAGGAFLGGLSRWAKIWLAVLMVAAAAKGYETVVFWKAPSAEVVTQDSSAGDGYPVGPEYLIVPDTCDGAQATETGEYFCAFASRVAPAPEPAGEFIPDTNEAPGSTGVPDSDGTVPDAACRTGTAAPRVRAMRPKTVRAVNRQWRRIERWLRANAPETYATLGKPGRARTIAIAEAQTGLRFPAALRASLLRHNGSGGFGFFDNQLLSVRQIRDTWRSLCEADDQDVDESFDPRDEWWDGRMIPFGADGSGDYIVIDSVVRDVGQTDLEGSMSFTPGNIKIPTYLALLRVTADALETGGSIGRWKPQAAGGALEWTLR